MKKLLLASTALVATAGMAAAEITISGGARFGVKYTAGTDAVTVSDGWADANDEVIAAQVAVNNSTSAADIKTAKETLATKEKALAAETAAAAATSSDTVIENRITLNIDGKTTIDSGAELSARVRIRGGNSVGDGGTTSASGVSAPRLGMSTGGFTLYVGNTSSAMEDTAGLYGGAVGLTGLSWGNLPINGSAAGDFFWGGFSSGSGDNGVQVIYSAGDMSVNVSHSEVTESTQASISYVFGDWTAALAVLDDDGGQEATLVTLGGSIGGANVGLKYGDVDNGADSSDATTVWASFDVASGTTVTGYFTSVDYGTNDDSYGLGFSHSLGGAVLKGGVASINDKTVADLGVSFTF